MTKFDVCVFGSLNIDYFTYLERQPKLGETIHAHGFMRAYGGKGANQCVMAARLGAKCVMLGKVGEDDDGESYKRALQQEGVDVAHLGTSKDATGKAFISVDDNGSNQIIIFAGANGDYAPEEVPKVAAAIADSKIFVTQLEVEVKSTLAALQAAHKAGVKTLFNPSPARTDLGPEWFAATDILIVNETEACICSGLTTVETREQQREAANALLDKGVEEVVMTLGGDGVLWFRRDAAGALLEDFVPAVKVPQVVDTTGAGDCFLGSLAAYLSHDVAMTTALANANAVAGMSVQKRNCQPSYPYKKELSADLHLP